MVKMPEMPSMDTAKDFAKYTAYALAANAILLGASRYVKQLPTVTINSLVTSTVLSGTAATLAQGATRMIEKDDNAYVKAGLIAAFVIAANVATTVDALKSRVSFLDMDLKSAAAHSVASTLGILGIKWAMTEKPIADVLNALAANIEKAYNDVEAAKKLPSTSQEEQDAKATATKKATDAHVAAVKAFTDKVAAYGAKIADPSAEKTLVDTIQAKDYYTLA